MNFKKALFISTILILISMRTYSQDYYWVSFTDKNNTNFSLSNPNEYLSERAIERREAQNIEIDSLDLPVNRVYIDSVLKLDAKLVHTSKWLNGITVQVASDSFPEKLVQLSFVEDFQLTKPIESTKSAIDKFSQAAPVESEPIDTSIYGPSVYQTGLLNGQFLHNQGFNGEGIHIGVLDGGFSNVDEYAAFDSLWANDQILGIKDFVNPDEDFFSTNYHGMSVLSCMGGNVPGQLVGTARKASYWLIRSEESGSEYIIEEDNWVAAAEFADSAGVDIINSSLGYSVFDDPDMNHTYEDMDGNTTRVTMGANIAASRGILVFSSAGNEGDDPWKYIVAPSDGEGVIGVGATNKFGFAAPFTSFGPAFGGNVKPNVAAVGWGTYLQHNSGVLSKSNGTSFSSPVMAGMAACLWQAVPFATSEQIKSAIELSSSMYENPDSLLGYGIPDFKKAWLYLTNNLGEELEIEQNWKVYPNPVRSDLVVEAANSAGKKIVAIELYTVEGRLLKKWVDIDSSRSLLTGFQDLPTGIFILKIRSNNSNSSIKLLKNE